jgi:two-component system KDP operon response regulator KdpE
MYKIKCLNAGVDGFLPKPFSMQDLMACTEPILKRNAEEISKAEPTKTSLVSGELKIEFAARRVTISNRDIKLSPTEFDILKELALNAGKVLTHNLLISRIWGSEYCHEREYLRIFVNRLRRKLEPTPGKPTIIVTIPWIGYKLNLPESRMNQ